MSDSTTSSADLRRFAAENSGRRKIDVETSLDLHRRAANQIDMLNEHVNELRQRLAQSPEVAAPAAPAAAQAPAPVAAGEDPSQAALMILQKAQVTADETITEANQIRAEADRTRREADAVAQAKADTAVAQARGQAASIIEGAEQRAAEVAAATAISAEHAADAQRSYQARVSSLRSDAESVVALARNMETKAGENLPVALTEQPFTEPINRPGEEAELVDASAPAMAEEAAPVEALDAAAAPEAEHELPPPPAETAPDAGTLPPPPADEDTSLLPPPPAPSTEFLPPPPDQTDDELIDLTEAELERALGGKSIDDELFGEDAVIDLTDETESAAGNFEFFSRD